MPVSKFVYFAIQRLQLNKKYTCVIYYPVPYFPYIYRYNNSLYSSYVSNCNNGFLHNKVLQTVIQHVTTYFGFRCISWGRNIRSCYSFNSVIRPNGQKNTAYNLLFNKSTVHILSSFSLIYWFMGGLPTRKVVI